MGGFCSPVGRQLATNSDSCPNFMKPINTFLRQNGLTVAQNPCVSPDFCLDWPALSQALRSGDPSIKVYEKSGFKTADGEWRLLEAKNGDCAWRLEGKGALALQEGIDLGGGRWAFP